MKKQIIIGLILTMIIAVFIPVYWMMESGRQEAALIRQHDEAVERASLVYSTTCALCHGAEGEGLIGPALRNTALDEKTLTKTISRGVPGTAMVAWAREDDGPLKDHQIKELVIFILDWADASAEEPAGTPQETPDTETQTGAELFSGNCAPCHGADRNGVSGLGPALIPTRLSELSDAEIKETILDGRTGTLMPPFGDKLSPEEIDVLLQFIKYTSP